MESTKLERRNVDRNFLTRLPHEVEEWQGQGIITPEQGRAIIDSYQQVDMAPAARGRLVTIVAILGSVLVGLGVILFFASNWQEIPREVKLALMLIAVPLTYGIGYWLRYRRGFQRIGTAIILLAALSYGAAIHLIAQAYNIPVNQPDLLSYWFLGVIPLAYVTRSQPILVLAMGLFLAAAGFRVQIWLDDFDLIPFRVFPLYLILGLMLYGLGKFQARFDLTRIYARAYEIVGLLTTFGALYLLTFRFWWEEFFSGSGFRGGSVATEFWLILYIASGLVVLTLVCTVIAYTRQRMPL